MVTISLGFIPTVAFIGRLKKHKLPHHAIEAFLLIKKEIPNAKMWIIGEGELYSELKKYDTEDSGLLFSWAIQIIFRKPFSIFM